MLTTDIDKLKQFVEKLEHLESEKATIQDQVADVLASAKDNGFDPKVIKQVLKLKKIDEKERETAGFLLDSYMLALGLAHSTND